MEFGNGYEVLQTGDRVKINDPRYVYYGRTGTIVQIEDISYNTVPICTVRLDETHGLAIISDEEFPRFKQIIEDLNKNSQYGCMPTISIYKIDGSLIRPANDTDSAYDILYLNNAKYVLAKYIWRPNGHGTELVKGVEKVL